MFTGWILEKLEDGWKNYLESTPITGSVSGSSPVTVYKGMDNVDKLDANTIIVYAQSMEQIDYGMNIYRVSMNFIYRYSPENADDTDLATRNATYKLITETVFNNRNIISDLESNSTDLHIIDMEFMSSQNGFDGSAWESSMAVEVICGINKS